MKLKSLVVIIAVFVISNCEKKIDFILSKFPLFEKTAKDTTLPRSVRESATTFERVLSEKPEISDRELAIARGTMMRYRNETTIATYVAFLKALEMKLPDQLPPAETYQAMEDKAGLATIIEYNVAQTIIMMSNSISNTTLYNDPAADAEIEGILKRFKEKHGNSETGKKILDYLNIVHEQGLQARSWGIKPWESPEPGSSY